MRILLVSIGVLVLAVVSASMWVGEGEVVTLTTIDDEGAAQQTQLWIVEIGGQLYLRSSTPDSHWLARLRAHPEVVLERDGQELELRAVVRDDAGVRAAVNRAMAKKYGGTDRLYSRVFDRGRSVPVRLEPRSETAQRRGSLPELGVR